MVRKSIDIRLNLLAYKVEPPCSTSDEKTYTDYRTSKLETITGNNHIAARNAIRIDSLEKEFSLIRSVLDNPHEADQSSKKLSNLEARLLNLERTCELINEFHMVLLANNPNLLKVKSTDPAGDVNGNIVGSMKPKEDENESRGKIMSNANETSNKGEHGPQTEEMPVTKMEPGVSKSTVPSAIVEKTSDEQSETHDDEIPKSSSPVIKRRAGRPKKITEPKQAPIDSAPKTCKPDAENERPKSVSNKDDKYSEKDMTNDSRVINVMSSRYRTRQRGMGLNDDKGSINDVTSLSESSENVQSDGAKVVLSFPKRRNVLADITQSVSNMKALTSDLHDKIKQKLSERGTPMKRSKSMTWDDSDQDIFAFMEPVRSRNVYAGKRSRKLKD